MKRLLSRIRGWYQKSRLRRSVDFLIELFKIDGNSYMPPALAFYLILSCVPMISIIFMILSFYSRTSVDSIFIFLESLNIFTDSEQIGDILKYLQNIQISDYVALIFSILASIYVASRGIECFSRFSDHFYGREDLDRRFFHRKLRSIGITLLMVIGISFTIILLTGFENMTARIIPGQISTWIKYPLAMVLLFVIIVLLFLLSPTEKVRLRSVLPGAYIASITLTLTVMLYGVYVSYTFKRMTSVYGPLASIIILLLLAYFISYVIFVCFYYNILIKKYREIKSGTSLRYPAGKRVSKKTATHVFVSKEEENKNR